jgi:hypothetical protein
MEAEDLISAVSNEVSAEAEEFPLLKTLPGNDW